MRKFILAITTIVVGSAILTTGLTACSSPQNRGVRVQVQDPCLTKCTSLFNRCTDDPAADVARCNQDRGECESTCAADEVTEEQGEGVITNE